MCVGAISHARIGRLIYGANEPKTGAVESGVRFFTSENCHHRPEIYPGIMADESKELLQDFFKKLR
jgi:tRNA(Arg) A34 adenosine deaminase TadA